MSRQTLVTASLRPHEVHLDLAGRLQKYPTIDTPRVFEIEHRYGKLAIEVREQKLSLGWAPAEEPPPDIPIAVSYFRADDTLYYPEILIPVPGYVQISRLT